MKFLCAYLVLLMACSVSFAQGRQDSVILLPMKIAVPENARKIGTIRAGNNATKTTCDYEEVVRSAKEKASAMGGNIVKITKLIDPAFISKCYSIDADIYHVDELPDYHLKNADDIHISSANNAYALLYVYRLKDTIALVSSYSVHLDNDSVICTVKSKSRDSVKIYKDGEITLWSKIEKRKELKLNVKSGGRYYIRCGFVKGEIRMIPVLELVDEETGKTEYDHLKKNKKDMDVRYLQQIH